jgi:hypothetical protein
MRSLKPSFSSGDGFSNLCPVAAAERVESAGYHLHQIHMAKGYAGADMYTRVVILEHRSLNEIYNALPRMLQDSDQSLF